MAGIERVDLHLRDGDDRTCVWETDEIQVMRARLAVGESLPGHPTNANVLVVPLTGTVKLVTGGRTEVLGVGEALSLPNGTPIEVSNGGDEPVVFLVLKTPHPRVLK